MAYTPNNTNGQKTMANSSPVVLASDQSTVPVSVSGVSTAANQSTANTSLASLETKIGEVQASPTANTVLDRLKAIATALAGTLVVATHAVTQSGNWAMRLQDSFGNTIAQFTPGDALAAAPTTAIGVTNHNLIFDGTNHVRERGNEDVTLLASAARTTTQTSADLINRNGQGALIVVLDMTTVGTGSVTISIDGKDTVSGKYYNLLTGVAVTTNSTNVYRIGPLIDAVANATAKTYLPRTFRIVVTANNANSATYSVGYTLVR